MEYKYNNLEEAIQVAKKTFIWNEEVYQEFNPEFWDNEEFVKAVIGRRNGYAIKYANDEIKNNKEIVLQALRANWQAYKLIDPSLLNDKDILMFMASQDHLKYMGNIDKQIQVELLKENPKCLVGLDDDIKSNRELVLEAVKKDASVYVYASDELKKDKELAMSAVQNNGSMFEYVNDSLKNDRELAMLAVQNNGYMLEYVSEDLKKDRELIVTAMITEYNHVATFINKIYGSEKREDPEIMQMVEEAKLVVDQRNLDYSRELVSKFLESGLTIDEFKKEYNVKDRELTNSVEILKNSNDVIYDLYANRTSSNAKQAFAIIVKGAENMARMIREGVPVGDYNRPFDVLDYYDKTHFEYDELLKIISNSKQISNEDMRTLKTFFAKTKNVKKPLNKDEIRSVKDMRLDESGNMYEFLTGEDKEALFEYLKQNKYPMREGTYYAAKNRYLNGYLDISEYEKDLGTSEKIR